MFSHAQKQHIAAEIEKLLLSFGHPEMPTERPRFMLHVEGKASWSWADIVPNWVVAQNGTAQPINPHNEAQALRCNQPRGFERNASEPS